MTRLAEVKQERDKALMEKSILDMCLLLALTVEPDHTERITIPGDAYRYVVTAYGLTRCNGGYVIVRGIYPGQRDSIRGYAFDDWQAQQQNNLVQFRIAAERIAVARQRLLDAAA